MQKYSKVKNYDKIENQTTESIRANEAFEDELQIKEDSARQVDEKEEIIIVDDENAEEIVKRINLLLN